MRHANAYRASRRNRERENGGLSRKIPRSHIKYEPLGPTQALPIRGPNHRLRKKKT